jgi:hypothetical protein
MTRAYQEITYTAPLSNPLELDAYLAPDPGDWRGLLMKRPCSKGMHVLEQAAGFTVRPGRWRLLLCCVVMQC